MSPHELPLLFQRFQRLPQADGVQPTGTGLGLTFVKAVVTQHRGHTEVFSALGIGTEFRIRIPARDGELTNIVI
jgi:two-component system sensor histidine kinase ResE